MYEYVCKYVCVYMYVYICILPIKQGTRLFCVCLLRGYFLSTGRFFVELLWSLQGG